MADRKGRVKALIAKGISDILLFDIKKPSIGIPSVNEVTVTDDYSLAKVYVSFIGAKYPYQNLAELNKCKGFVRSSLAKKLDIYKVPDIVFIYDDSYDRAESLEAAIKRGEEEIEEARNKK